MLVAAIVTLFSLTSAIPAHAANSSLSNESEAVVILDNMEKRVAASEDAQYKYIATLIKTSNTVTLEKIDKATLETVSINTYPLNTKPHSKDTEITTMAASSYENTFSNYEFTIWYTNPIKWELRRPNGILNTYYFQTYETSRNRDALLAFQSKVYEINDIEWEYIASVGLEALTGVIGAILSGGLGAFIADVIFSAKGGIAPSPDTRQRFASARKHLPPARRPPVEA